MKYSIIIPTWNNARYLEACVNSILTFSKYKHQIVVHLNGCIDDSENICKKYGIDYTKTDKNMGVCIGVNTAYKKCIHDRILYLNDDMIVLPKWDIELVNFEKKYFPDYTTPVWLSGTMIEPTGNNICCIAPRNYGTTIETFNMTELLLDLKKLKADRSHMQGSTWPPTLLRRKHWDMIGGFSEEFSPGMGSDPDLARKMWEIGCRDFIGVSTSLVYHFQCKSTGRIRKNNGRLDFRKKWNMDIDTFVYDVINRGKKFEENIK